MNVTFELPADAQQRLRELRLWHWREAMINRRLAKLPYTSRNRKENHERAADMHIRFVQTLNDFFPIGDTAEKDNAS